VVSNLYVRQANLKVILELTGSQCSVVQREEQWPVVVKGWVRLREQLRLAHILLYSLVCNCFMVFCF